MTANGDKTSNPQIINTVFESYHKQLYSSECSATNESFQKFFDLLKLPSLSKEAKADLDSPITPADVSDAPGPDELPIDIYKIFKNKIISPLLDMFVESFNSGKLQPSLRNALIILILKSGKSPTKCESYQLISLINSDAKIIAKILGHRLERYLPSFSDPDQNGFIKGRQAWHCICRVLNIIYARTEHPDTAVLSADASSV